MPTISFTQNITVKDSQKAKEIKRELEQYNPSFKHVKADW